MILKQSTSQTMMHHNRLQDYENIIIEIVQNYDALGKYVCTLCAMDIHGNVEEHVATHQYDHHENHNMMPQQMPHRLQDFIQQMQQNGFVVQAIPIQADMIQNLPVGAEFAGQIINNIRVIREQLDDIHEQIHNVNERVADAAYSYHCPVCSKGYNDQINLNRHFIRRHNRMEDFELLDNKIKNGYPTLEILQIIKAMQFIRNDEKHDTECFICADKYDECKQSQTDDFYDPLKSKNKYSKFNDDHKLIFHQYQNIHNKYPIKMTCCKTELCSDCFQKHIASLAGDVVCPFCKKDHTQTNNRFIVCTDKLW